MPETLLNRIAETPRLARYGRVTRVVGLVIEAAGLDTGLGELCRLTSFGDERRLAKSGTRSPHQYLRPDCCVTAGGRAARSAKTLAGELAGRCA